MILNRKFVVVVSKSLYAWSSKESILHVVLWWRFFASGINFTFTTASIFHIPKTGCFDSCIFKLTIPDNNKQKWFHYYFQIILRKWCIHFYFSCPPRLAHKLICGKAMIFVIIYCIYTKYYCYYYCCCFCCCLYADKST